MPAVLVEGVDDIPDNDNDAVDNADDRSVSEVFQVALVDNDFDWVVSADTTVLVLVQVLVTGVVIVVVIVSLLVVIGTLSLSDVVTAARTLSSDSLWSC